MARPGVTYTDVANTALQLVAAGKVPTIEAIRRILGTGSNSTLGEHLRNWKTRQDSTQQLAARDRLPEELIAVLQGLWNKVMDESDDKIHTVQQQAQQESNALHQAIQNLEQNHAQLQQQHQQIKHERDSYVHDKATVEQMLANAKLEIAALTEKLTGAEHQRQEKQARIDELHRQHQQVQANLEHYRNAALEQRLADEQRYQQQLNQLEQSVQQLNQKLSNAQQEKTLLQQQLQQSIFENEHLTAGFNKLTTQHEAICIRLTDTTNELAKKAHAEQHWQEQFQILQTKYNECIVAGAEIKTQHALSLQQLQTVQHELKELRNQNKLLAHEKWELGQEKAQLLGQLRQLETQI